MKKIRARWTQYRLWAKANRSKELKEMPRWYLVVQALLSTFIAAMLSTILIPATPVFIQAFDRTAGWLYLLIGIWFAAFWFVFLFAFIVSQTHGRALGDLLFNSPVKS